jgi:hypothetical protein
MKEYLYLFRGGDMSPLTEEQKNAHLKKWGDWIGALAKEGKYVGGDPLGKESRSISGKKKVISDGPFAEAKEVVGGYLIVKADSLEEATEMAKGCPTYEIDGITEIRDIFHMDM